jgi:hypothetical protein
MRQRLGIGAALLGDPEVLILDERPTGWTGGHPLDAGPAQGAGRQGRTVLSAICCRRWRSSPTTVIIAAGKLVAGAVADDHVGRRRADAGADPRPDALIAELGTVR